MVAAAVARLSDSAAHVIACSGGRDSSVLLHAAVRAGLRLRALHVDHGLHADSAEWAAWCQAQCARLGVSCRVLRLDAPPAANREAWARERRYAALQAALAPGEILLTAHHQRDQAETVLLHLLRGSGERGLAGMAAERRLGAHRLLRPLLDVPADAIQAWADAHGLQWLEDPSNAALYQDRNFLRHEILPRLAERFGAVERNLARSAALLGEIAALGAVEPAEYARGAGLDLARLAGQPPAVRNRVLLAWLRALDLPPPRHRMLGQIWRQFLEGADDAQPRIAWPGAELRRYRGVLHAMAPLAPPTVLDWPVAAHGEAIWPHGGVLRWRLPGPGRICTPRGGESLLLDGHHRRLKGLCQAAGVPPWQRRRLPLLFLNGELLAAGDRWRAAPAPSFVWRWVRENSHKVTQKQ